MRISFIVVTTLFFSQCLEAAAKTVQRNGTASGTISHHHVHKQSYQTGFSAHQSTTNAMSSPGVTPSGWVTKSTNLHGVGTSMHSAQSGFSPPAPKTKPAEIKPESEIKPGFEVKVPEPRVIPTPKIQDYQ